MACMGKNREGEARMAKREALMRSREGGQDMEEG